MNYSVITLHSFIVFYVPTAIIMYYMCYYDFLFLSTCLLLVSSEWAQHFSNASCFFTAFVTACDICLSIFGSFDIVVTLFHYAKYRFVVESIE